MYRVDFSPESERHFRKLHRWIRKQASLEIADNYTAAIARFCEDLHTFPHRGTKREDLRSGLRTMGFHYRVSVAFSVSDKEQLVAFWESSTAAEVWRKPLRKNDRNLATKIVSLQTRVSGAERCHRPNS